MADNPESRRAPAVYVLTPSGIKKVSKASVPTSLSEGIPGEKVDTSAFLQALQDTINELQKELEDSDNR